MFDLDDQQTDRIRSFNPEPTATVAREPTVAVGSGLNDARIPNIARRRRNARGELRGTGEQESR